MTHDLWLEQIKVSLQEFAKKTPRFFGRRLDPTYGILATSILWPVRKAAQGNATQHTLLEQVSGSETALLLPVMKSWNEDRLQAARQLQKAARNNDSLRAALDHLLAHFKDSFTNENLLQPATNINVFGRVFGGNVNIGGQQYVFGNVIVELNVSVFTSLSQVALVLAVLVGIGALGAFAIWQAQQPPKMPVEQFNIAVADIQLPEVSNEAERTRAKDAAARIRQTLVSALNDEYANNNAVQVEDKNMGVVRGTADAEALVAKTNADMIIYGRLFYLESEDLYIWKPTFYVAREFNADVEELIGESPFGETRFNKAQLDHLIVSDSEEYQRLNGQAQLLVEFTKALTYFSVNQNTDAVTSIRSAVKLADGYVPSEDELIGKKVIYLFASTITRLTGNLPEALTFAQAARDADVNYGRAYIALGNVYYEMATQAAEKNRDDPIVLDALTSALDAYEAAANIQGQEDTYLIEKAQASLGNVAMLLAQLPIIEQSGRKQEYLKKALTAYQVVLDSYTDALNTGSPRTPHLARLAQGAAFSSGLIYTWLGETSSAIDAFSTSLSLTSDPTTIAAVQAQLIPLQTQVAATAVTPYP